MTVNNLNATIVTNLRRQNLKISSPAQWLKYCLRLVFLSLYALFLSLANPVIISINFIYVWNKLAVTSGQNIAALPIKLVPAWLAAGMGIYAILGSILFITIYTITKLPFSRIMSINLKAHLPFLPFLLFSQQLAHHGFEWNIGGFILVPIFLVMAAILIPVSLLYAVFLIRKERREQASNLS